MCKLALKSIDVRAWKTSGILGLKASPFPSAVHPAAVGVGPDVMALSLAPLQFSTIRASVRNIPILSTKMPKT